MALAPFMPRVDSGMLQDDLFAGMLSPFLGTMSGPLSGAGAVATQGTRPLYVDVSEGENSYDLKADVPGACRCQEGSRQIPRAQLDAALTGSTLRR
jgi:hypothetical protein